MLVKVFRLHWAKRIPTGCIDRAVFPILPTGYGKSLCFASLHSIYDELFHAESSVVIAVANATHSNHERAGCYDDTISSPIPWTKSSLVTFHFHKYSK